MGSMGHSEKPKPHAVCIPYPAQGHITPMLKLAKLLHHRGFHVTFVNTEYNHNRLRKSQAVSDLPSFRFATIPDGLPPTDSDVTQDIPSLCESTRRTCLPHFKELLAKLNDVASFEDGVPPVSCVVSDGVMSFTLDAAEELGVPEVLFWTTSACGFLGYMHYRDLIDRGIVPLKDESYLTNGYLDTVIDWIPAMSNIKLKDLPTFLRTTNPDEFMVEFVLGETERSRSPKPAAIILNTFDALEHDVLASLSNMLAKPVYSIGPLQLLANDQTITDPSVKNISSSLWKEESECLDWLETKPKNSVVYVNFGSITVMTNDQLVEFAWGLANSKKDFLWVIRPDLVAGETAVLPPEFVAKTRDRGLLASWCPQEQVLNHESVAGFLTHNGWNSTLESVSAGVPMICWPFFAEQQTNCWFACNEWGVGMEINSDVKRDEVEAQVRELVDGRKGGEMRKKAAEWKRIAAEAVTGGGGSSFAGLDSLIERVLLSSSRK
uniref:linamarin synthase n=2 Tax=Linum usitatissimum TaxID=4006 RepID=A8WEP1_LINUS|nr:glucosyltransferase [Linum usitatissimum]